MASPSLASVTNPFGQNASQNAADRKSPPARSRFIPEGSAQVFNSDESTVVIGAVGSDLNETPSWGLEPLLLSGVVRAAKNILTLSAYRIDYVAHDLDPTASVAVSKALETQVCLTLTKLIGRVNTAATIKVHVPSPLRGYCAGRSELAIPATTVRAALEELERRHPALHRGICDETGTVRRHINLFVNTNHIRDCKGIDTPLAPGDEVTILPAVSGG